MTMEIIINNAEDGEGRKALPYALPVDTGSAKTEKIFQSVMSANAAR